MRPAFSIKFNTHRSYASDALVLTCRITEDHLDEPKPVKLTSHFVMDNNIFKQVQEVRRYERVALSGFSSICSGLEELEDYRASDGYPLRLQHAQARRRDLAMCLITRMEIEERKEYISQRRGRTYRYSLIGIHRAYDDCQKELDLAREQLKTAMHYARQQLNKNIPDTQLPDIYKSRRGYGN